MFMLEAFLLWTWPTCTKGTCREIPYRTDEGRRDGTDRVTHARSYADGENNSKQGQGLSLFIPHITK